jgi:hypothetical protein
MSESIEEEREISSRVMVRQIAAMVRYSDNPADAGLIEDTADAVDVLNALILRARKILNLPTPSDEEKSRAEIGY